MKLYFIPEILAVVATIACYLAVSLAPHPSKYFAVEPETKVRPERFELMKFHNVDVRQPASSH